jgi:hypothetical protein
MRRAYRTLLLALIIALALTGVAQAQDQSLYWERFDVNVTVLPSGDFVVEEVQEIIFTSGEFHFGYRSIPMDRLENITGVWDEGTLYSRDAAQLHGHKCPSCGGAVELAGKGVVGCPYCGAEIFLTS